MPHSLQGGEFKSFSLNRVDKSGAGGFRSQKVKDSCVRRQRKDKDCVMVAKENLEEQIKANREKLFRHSGQKSTDKRGEVLCGVSGIKTV